MKMETLITLGCSLTEQTGIKERIALLTNRQLVNLGQGAGSNGLQIYKLHEYIINVGINENDIILWQITSAERLPIRLNPNKLSMDEIINIQQTQFTPVSHEHYVESTRNLFDNKARIDILCNSPIITKSHIMEFDFEQQLQTLLATIILLNTSHKKLLIFFGWSTVLSDNQKSIFLKKLIEHSINYIDNPYVEWAKFNNKTFRDDGRHPSELTGEQFADEIIIPKLHELGWI